MKITRSQKETLEAAVAKLRDRESEVRKAIDNFNVEMHTAWEGLQHIVSAYNEELEEARSLRDEITGDGEATISEKTEKWQESEKGQAAQNWVDEWSKVELDDLELEEPEELDEPTMTHADDLENSPAES